MARMEKIFRPNFSSITNIVFKGEEYSPRRLFLPSSQGAWFEALDTSTVFSNLMGTTVATTGATVARINDKSKQLALGPELVTNGDFSVPSGWTLGTNWAITGGQLVGTSVPAFTVASQSNTQLVAGRTYEISYTITSFTSGSARVSFSGGSVATGINRGAIGTFRELLIANAGNNVITFGSGSAGFSGSVDNVSVRELQGNHAIQSTAGDRPTYTADKAVQNVSSDSLNWTAPADTYTIAYLGSAGSVVLTSQSLSGATNIMLATKIFEYIAVNRQLGSAELRRLLEYLNQKAELL